MMVVTNASGRASRSMAELTGHTGSASGALRRGPSKFQRGSVWRLRMKNFLVYKDALVQFGPRLNMVIGPNGSGKSAIVCGLGLGLGGSTKGLGRADNLSSFVTHGVNQDASVEVELFMSERDGKVETMRIRRLFCRRSNSSKWFINDRLTSDKEVKLRIAELGIQVDNLCTMLPQDKVGDFSGFSADKLLIETEKAMSLDQLHEPHQKLIEMQESAGTKGNEEDTMSKKLETITTELQGLEQAVTLFMERQQKIEQLELRQKKKIWQKVEDLAAEGKESRREMKEAQSELVVAEREDKPLKDEEKRWEREDHRLRGVVQNRMAVRTQNEKDAEAAGVKIERLVGEAMTTKSEMKNIETRRKKKLEHLARTKKDLANTRRMHHELKEQCDTLDTVDETTQKMRENQAKHANADAELDAALNSQKVSARAVNDIDRRVKELTNLKAIRLQKFTQKFGFDAKAALDAKNWADRNPDRLRGPVAGPIGLEATVDDDEAAIAIENHVAGHIWTSLVVDCKEDHDTIIEQFKNESRGLNIQINQGGRLQQQPVIFSRAEMAHLEGNGGVRGFLDDFLECPNTVRQVLRRSTKLHRAFLGSALTQRRIATDPHFLSTLVKPVNGVAPRCVIYAGGRRGLSPGQAAEIIQQYSVKISLYGQRKASTRVIETRPAMFTTGGVDEAAVREQEAKKAEELHKLSVANERVAYCKRVDMDLRKGYDELAKQAKSNLSRRKQLSTLSQNVMRQERNIEDMEADLARGGDAEKSAKVQRLETIFKNHAATIAHAQELLKAVLESSLEVMAANVARATAVERLTQARQAVAQASESRRELKAKVQHLTRQTDRLKREFQGAKSYAEGIAPRFVNGNPDNVTDFGAAYDDLPSSIVRLDEEIDSLNEQLASSIHNPQVVQKHQKLKKEVEELEKALESLRQQNAHAESTMKAVKDAWQQRLDTIVHKLSDLFGGYMREMGQEGEVVLAGPHADPAREEPFKRWGISIRVRFRDAAEGAKLTELNKHVHSGGERSVSTIMYLMAIQDLQFSPIRVVDEINQGMDARNERLVFSRIVRNSCGPERKQYFLVTPKMLQGLVAMDNDDVNVIVIMNGMNVFNGTEAHSMKNFIKAKKRQLELEGSGMGGAQGGSLLKQRRGAE